MNPWIMRGAVMLWVLALLGTLVFRGSQAANLALLVVSIGLIVTGIFALRRK
jgi:hypothetical protein